MEMDYSSTLYSRAAVSPEADNSPVIDYTNAPPPYEQQKWSANVRRVILDDHKDISRALVRAKTFRVSNKYDSRANFTDFPILSVTGFNQDHQARADEERKYEEKYPPMHSSITSLSQPPIDAQAPRYDIYQNQFPGAVPGFGSVHPMMYNRFVQPTW